MDTVCAQNLDTPVPPIPYASQHNTAPPPELSGDYNEATTAMPEEIFIDSTDPDSGTYQTLIEKSRRSDQPSLDNASSEELTVADSIPPSSSQDEIAAGLISSLRPAPLPEFPAINSSFATQIMDKNITADNANVPPSIDAYLDGIDVTHQTENEIIEALNFIEGSRDSVDLIEFRVDSTGPPPPVTPTIDEKRLKMIEEYQREQTLSELKEKFNLEFPMADFLPIQTVIGMGALMLDCHWILNEEQLREVLITLLIALDPGFGSRLKTKQRNITYLINLFLERLEFYNYHILANNLRKNMPKKGSLPPPLPNR